MDCVAYYLGYCPVELWPLAGLAGLVLLVLSAHEKGSGMLARSGWFVRALLKSVVLCGGFAYYYYTVGVPVLGNLEENLSACNARNRMAYMPACRR